MNCLLCILLAAEREVTALKAELDAAHDRLADLESEILLEKSNHSSISVELVRAKERIVSTICVCAITTVHEFYMFC